MRNTALYVAAIATTGMAFAQYEDAQLQTSFEIGGYSKYVWRGINLVDEFVVQPSLTFSYGPWSANFWGNYETTDVNNYYLTSTGKNRITEWDSTLSYKHMFEKGVVTLGVTHYDFPNTGFASTTEIWANLAMNLPYSPYVLVAFDVDESDGIYARIGGSHTLPTNNEMGSFTVGSWVGFGDKKNNNYYLGNNNAAFADFGIDARYTHKFTDKVSGFAGATFTTLLDSKNLQGAPNRSNFVFNFGLGFSF